MKALDQMNKVIEIVSELFPEDLIQTSGYENVKEYVVRNIKNKTASGQMIVDIFVKECGGKEQALKVMQEYMAA